MAAKFPTAVATDADLLVAKNRAQTTLAGNLNSSDTSFTLTSDVFGVDVAITIENEIILILAKSGATVTNCTRGFDGTAAASHTSGKLVSAFIDAIHHNQVSAEIQAIETALGANLSNIPAVTYPIAINKGGTNATTASAARTNLGVAASGANSDITSLTGLSTPLSVPQGGSGAVTLTGILQGNGASAFSAVAAASEGQIFRRKYNAGTTPVYEFTSPWALISSDFMFAAQAPGGSLTIGSNTITLSPVPPGVNGSDTAHKLYISAGTGTAEAVLITGGTAVAGAASGTVIVTCANTHSGAWTIQSATAGIQEAIVTLGAAGGQVTVPGGTWLIYGTITLDSLSHVSIVGLGIGASLLSAQFTSGDLFHFIGTESVNGFNLSVSGFSMTVSGANTLTFIRLTGSWYFFGKHNFMSGALNAFKIEANGASFAGAIYIDQNEIAGVPANGTGISANGAQDIYITHNVIAGNGASGAVGILLTKVLAGAKLAFNDIFDVGVGLKIAPANGQVVSAIESTSNYYDSNPAANVYIVPAAGGTVNHIRFVQDWFSSSPSGPGLWISGAGVIDDLICTSSIIAGNGTQGVLIDSATATFLKFADLTVSRNSTVTPGLNPGFAITAAATHIQISGGTFAPTVTEPTNTQSYGIYLAAVASDYLDIHNADVRGNLTGGLANGSTGTHNTIVANGGYNPVGQSAITVGASPFTYTTGSSPETIYVRGGTVSNISVGSTQVAAASPAQLALGPNQAITVTYSALPTMIKDVK